RYSTAAMQSDSPLRVAVTLRRDAPRWHNHVIDALIADCGLRIADLLRIQSTINPQSVPRQARDALSLSKGEILNPQYEVLIDLAGTARPEIEPRFGVWQFGFGDGAPLAEGAPGTSARLYRTTSSV